MHVLSEVGEIGVFLEDGRSCILRPTLYHMTQIGDPKEIVEIYASVMAEESHKDQFTQALAVIYACADEDVSDVFGHYDSEWRYVPGIAPAKDILPLARCLLKHGVTGALPPMERPDGKEQEYVSEFVARDHVAMAVAHLGMSERESWGCTMTSLVGALKAKFPTPERENAPPTDAQLDEALDWHDKVLAARAAKKGK